MSPGAWASYFYDLSLYLFFSQPALLLRHITEFGTYFTNGLIDGENIPTVAWQTNVQVRKLKGTVGEVSPSVCLFIY